MSKEKMTSNEQLALDKGREVKSRLDLDSVESLDKLREQADSSIANLRETGLNFTQEQGENLDKTTARELAVVEADAGEALSKLKLVLETESSTRTGRVEEIDYVPIRDLLELIRGKEVASFGLSDGKAVGVDGDDEESKYLMTTELNGCLLSLILSEDDSGKRIVQGTHFPTLFNPDRQINKIKQLPYGDEKSTKKSILFTHETRTASKYLSGLKEGIKNLGVAEESISEVPYNSKEASSENFGTIIVEVPPSRKGGIKIYTWNKTYLVE